MRNDGTLVAAEAFKSFALPAGVQGVTPASALSALIKDKDWHMGALIELGHFGGLEPLLAHFYRLDQTRGAYGFNRLAMSGAEALKDASNRLTTMNRSNPDDHKAIDASAHSSHSSEFVIGSGASARINIPKALGPDRIPVTWRDVPIAILGYGAAGMMLSFSLQRLGFTNVNTLNKTSKKLGVWDVPNVYIGTKNNPRELNYIDVASVGAAPGPGNDIRGFLARFDYFGISVTSSLKKLTTKGKGLEFNLDFGSGPMTYGIVVNCMGLGSPTRIHDSLRRMEGPGERAHAVRWQNPSLSESDVKGKRFIFIGLGNSTAEMLRVIHTLQDRGVDCDYRVFTHYPRDAVHNPSHTVDADGQTWRMFRDLSAPNLTSYQGDLPQSRQDYLRALYTKRIIHNVSRWDVCETKGNKPKIVAYNGYGKDVFTGEYDQLYILTGYRHSKEDLESYGFENLYEDWPLLDWDGEVNNGSRAVKGLFALGAVAQAPWAKNNIVIPGMMFRMSDMLMSIIMRAGEYYHTKK